MPTVPADDPLLLLGEFATALTWEAIPEPARRRAALAVRDTLGTILGGRRTTAARLAERAADQHPSSASAAAFATAVAASALDFDDGHYRGGAIHPSSVVVPALIHGAADLASVDRRRFTVAQVVGYEIGLRAAALLWPKHPDDDYHCTGTGATLGAGAAVAVMRGHDADTVARAIAIAWAHAPMATFQLPMVKESIGWSAATAVFAADLAAVGFMARPAGPASPLDATFPPTPFHRPAAMEVPIVASLGTVFETTEIYAKPFAACRYTHTALRSLRKLIDDGLTAADVRAITVRTPRPSMHLTEQRPSTLEHAQYSFPFVLAAMLHRGHAGASDIAEELLTDEAILRTAGTITVAHDPALDATYPEHYAATLAVDTADGTIERTRLVAPGDPADPMTDAELAAKFVALGGTEHEAEALVADSDAHLGDLIASVLSR